MFYRDVDDSYKKTKNLWERVLLVNDIIVYLESIKENLNIFFPLGIIFKFYMVDFTI